MSPLSNRNALGFSSGSVLLPLPTLAVRTTSPRITPARVQRRISLVTSACPSVPVIVAVVRRAPSHAAGVALRVHEADGMLRAIRPSGGPPGNASTPNDGLSDAVNDTTAPGAATAVVVPV